MSIRKSLFATLLGGSAALLIAVSAGAAQDKVSPEVTVKVTDGDPDRFSLVAVDGGILRVDRQNGTVTICMEQSDAWRCNPVPLAEDAYLAEINDLAAEVDRLKARLAELESDADGTGLAPETETGRSESSPGDGEKPSGKPRLLDKEEEELEKVLTFTESAMRRFFGMVRELQKEFDDETGN
ncbi:hypothetical protein [Roseibium sp.]|uniref:hypothetical protein n=1 Tax=Roseibium sp. TaxID=1936156 RepID=UPI003D0B5B4A